jgi:hypothetical protein
VAAQLVATRVVLSFTELVSSNRTEYDPEWGTYMYPNLDTAFSIIVVHCRKNFSFGRTNQIVDISYSDTDSIITLALHWK